MPQTTDWQIPYPGLDDPADINGDMTGTGFDDMATRIDFCLTKVRATGSIPGEVKLWSGGALPDITIYGHWAWADGRAYDVATYPIAAAHIDTAWRVFDGATDPGPSQFRVPDLRGVTPTGMDAMPGGTAAGRVTRSVSLILAARTGEEVHTIALSEMAAHAHDMNDPSHWHNMITQNTNVPTGSGPPYVFFPRDAPEDHGGLIEPAYTGVSLQMQGGGGAHENMQPSVFVPYICKLDD
jgi:microcystin-dependent protein